MGIGFDAKIPLYNDVTDGFYGLNKTTKENVRQSLKMLMLTAPGERMMLPQYGVGLRNFLFENTPEQKIIAKIRQQMAIYLPDLQIIKLSVSKKNPIVISQTGQPNTLGVQLVYLIKALNMEDTLKLSETLEGVGN